MAKELLDILVVFAIFGGLALFVWLLAWQQDLPAIGWRRRPQEWDLSGPWQDLRRWWRRRHEK